MHINRSSLLPFCAWSEEATSKKDKKVRDKITVSECEVFKQRLDSYLVQRMLTIQSKVYFECTTLYLTQLISSSAKKHAPRQFILNMSREFIHYNNKMYWFKVELGASHIL